MNEIDKEKRPFFNQDNSLFVRSELRVQYRTARVFPANVHQNFWPMWNRVNPGIILQSPLLF